MKSIGTQGSPKLGSPGHHSEKRAQTTRPTHHKRPDDIERQSKKNCSAYENNATKVKASQSLRTVWYLCCNPMSEALACARFMLSRKRST